MAFQFGSIFSRFDLDTKPLLKNLKSAGSRVATFTRDVGRRFANAGRRIAGSFLGPLKSIGPILATVGTAFGTLSLIQRAKEISNASNAFRSLTNSIGETSAEFLGKLDKALSGTVPKLELIAAANQAIVLGVAKSSDAFAELAAGAKRLGAALGRTATESLEDIVVGIGRGSKLILDNLGLIIDLEKANTAYAAALGTTADALTESQKKAAFFEATLQAVREKVASLGPSVLSLADRFDILNAGFQNLVTIFAEELISGDLALRFGRFLQDSEKTVRRIAIFARNFIDDLVRRFDSLVETFRDEGAESGLKKLIDRGGAFLRDSVIAALQASLTFLTNAAKPVIKVLANLALRAGIGVANSIVKLLVRGVDGIARRLLSVLPRQFQPKLAPLEDVLAEVDRIFSPDKADQLIDIQGAFAEIGKAAADAAKGIAGSGGVVAAFEAAAKGASKLVQGKESPLSQVDLKLRDIARRTKEAQDAIRGFNDQAFPSDPGQGITDQVAALTNQLKELDEIERRSAEARQRTVSQFTSGVGGTLPSISLGDTASLKDQLREIEAISKRTTEALGESLNSTQLARLQEERAEIQKALASVPSVFAGELQQIDAEIQELGLDDFQLRLLEGERRFAAIAETISDKTSPAFQKLSQDFDEFKKRLNTLRTNQEAFDFAGVISQNVVKGLVEGFKAGEKPAKVFSRVLSSIFESTLNDAIKRLTTTLQSALAKVFQEGGFLGGAAGFAGALIGVAGAIVSNLESRKSSTVDDFSTAVDSSEALRGVVVGPTNVAIGRVGNALKGALRQSEIFLQRIAEGVELIVARDSTGASASTGPGGAVRLSSSTIS